MTMARAPTRRRNTARIGAQIGSVAAVLALLATAFPAPAAAQSAIDERPGPRVMLCLYGAEGQMLAGSPHCPDRARPRDAILPAAHCFYDREGRLWRGLPRCPRTAPPFLMDEARGQ
ncbi:hypothetical protein F1188_11400 [Roseospira marina]|uniref:DUF333 domain-containing protein n=1 Tax=Roseospira marina TaxID=140057 RepID=A0A5M6IB82_9PROT|nr:hypothetical protein [Roseospira marina]KAA5605493.1 hypothetical protein F1188_11400 [Roseospira marina]MBB4314504.1 hypothetical protein [Roseospira marina]MBB5088668.1 hypothetical protein [Roseospira marina]